MREKRLFNKIMKSNTIQWSVELYGHTKIYSNVKGLTELLLNIHEHCILCGRISLNTCLLTSGNSKLGNIYIFETKTS